MRRRDDWPEHSAHFSLVRPSKLRLISEFGMITTIENSWRLMRRIHQNMPYGLSGKLMSRHRCKTM